MHLFNNDLALSKGIFKITIIIVQNAEYFKSFEFCVEKETFEFGALFTSWSFDSGVEILVFQISCTVLQFC